MATEVFPTTLKVLSWSILYNCLKKNILEFNHFLAVIAASSLEYQRKQLTKNLVKVVEPPIPKKLVKYVDKVILKKYSIFETNTYKVGPYQL